MLFGNLFYYGYEKAIFERQAKLDLIVCAGMIEALSRIDDLKRDNLPLYFSRAFYESYNKTQITQ